MAVGQGGNARTVSCEVVDPGLHRIVLLPTVIVGLRGHDLVEIPLLLRLRELVGTAFRELEDAALRAALVPVDAGAAECLEQVVCIEVERVLEV